MRVIPPTRRIRLRVDHWGKIPPKLAGERVYKFFRESGRLLKNRGWEVVKSTSQYLQLRVPEGVSPRPPFVIEVVVPTREELLRMAEDALREGVEWSGLVGEWPSGFVPATEQPALVLMDDDTGLPVPGQAKTYMSEPRFTVGLMNLSWNAEVTWMDGVPDCYEKPECVVREAPPGTPEAPESESERYEGSVRRVESNRYERDTVARSRCIAHHGTACAVCGFDFGRAYGGIARGYIHVHHSVPVSGRGGEYKVDPVGDLVPVCPNCHAVMHLKDPPLSVDEVRSLMRTARAHT